MKRSINKYNFLLLIFVVFSMILAYFLLNLYDSSPYKVIPNKKPEEGGFDLVLKGGHVIDGTGRPGFTADIGIKGDKIVLVGRVEPAKAKQILSIENLTVAPGFINPHSHIDQSILQDRAVEPSLLQGITTELVGVDGESRVSLKDHFSEVFSRGGIGVNYGSFVGQGSVRRAVIGDEDKILTENELAAMRNLVAKAMQEGAFGLSTGLEYPPGFQTATWEIVELAKVAQKYGGVYSTHMRDEGPNILDAVAEALAIGKEANIPVNISHLKINGATNDATVAEKLTNGVLTQLEAAKQEGLDVFADLYPYTTTYFKVNVPIEEVYGKFPDHTVFISKSSRQAYLDKSLTDIATIEKTTVTRVFELLRQEPETRAYVQNLSKESLIRFLEKEYTMIGVDAPTAAPKGVPDKELRIHPRRFGTYPRVLSRIVREEKVLTLPEAIRKMSGLVAEKYNIPMRGVIREGYYADLVVFDSKKVLDRATFSNPTLKPQGIEYVFVNGSIAVAKGELSGRRLGEPVRPDN